jgi:hypothetical protein
MGDEEPATKGDLNNIMTHMDAMMAAMESQKSQLDSLTSGTLSTTPPTPVDTSGKDKPSLNDEDPEKDGNENNEDPPRKMTPLGDIARRFHTLRAMSPEGTFKCHTLPHAAHRHLLMLLALPIGKITCALT